MREMAGTLAMDVSLDRPRPGRVRGASVTSPDLLSAWFQRVVRSDESAFESLFRALHPVLLDFADRMLGDRAAARDLVQEAFVRFWEHRERHDPSGSPKALLFRTVRNLALNQIRDLRRREELLSGEAPMENPTAPSPDDLLDRQELGDRLREWIDGLPERQREALVLSRFEGLSHEEIAEVMEVSPRTVNNHLVRALRSLRERMSELT